MSRRTTSTSETSDVLTSLPAHLTLIEHMTNYCVYQRKGQGNYLVSFTLPTTGKKTNRSTGTANKREAFKRAEQIVAQSYLPPEEDKHHVADLLDAYRTYQIEVRKTKEISADRTRKVLNDMCNALVIQNMDDLLNYKAINAWLSEMFETHARTTVRQNSLHVISFFNWLQKKDYIDKDVAKKIDRIKTTDEDKTLERGYWTKEELEQLHQACMDGADGKGWTREERAMTYKLAAGSGLRRGEICQVEAEDFHLDADNPFVFVRATTSKNGKNNKQYLPSGLTAELKQFIAGKTGPLFTGYPSDLSVWLATDRDNAGIPKKDSMGRSRDFHAMRATYITNLIEAGVDIKSVQQLARHANPVLTLNVYAKVKDDRLADAARLLD